MDYNLCFQSINLSVISRLRHINQFNKSVEGEWAGVIGCCVKEVFEGEYAMTEPPNYGRVSLAEKENVIVVRTRNMPCTASDASHEVYGTAYYAIKWANFMDRKTEKDENPGFINLTEFSRVSMGRMLSCLAVRLIIKSKGNRIQASNKLGWQARPRTSTWCQPVTSSGG
ncbi:Uncharacterised protein g7217 [Pycnogonum litorale]